MVRTLIMDFAMKGKRLKGNVVISDEVAMFQCQDWKITREMYEAESKLNHNVTWDDQKKAMFEFFPSKKEAWIADKIQSELAILRKY